MSSTRNTTTTIITEFPAKICSEVSPSSSVAQLKTFVSRLKLYKKSRGISDKNALASVILFLDYEMGEWFEKNEAKFKTFENFLKMFTEKWIHDESMVSLEHKLSHFKFSLYGNIPDQLREYWKLATQMFGNLKESLIVKFFRVHIIKDMKLRTNIDEAQKHAQLMQLLSEYAQRNPINRSVFSSQSRKSKPMLRIKGRHGKPRYRRNRNFQKFKKHSFYSKNKQPLRQIKKEQTTYTKDTKKGRSTSQGVRAVLTYNY